MDSIDLEKLRAKLDEALPLEPGYIHTDSVSINTEVSDHSIITHLRVSTTRVVVNLTHIRPIIKEPDKMGVVGVATTDSLSGETSLIITKLRKLVLSDADPTDEVGDRIILLLIALNLDKRNERKN